MIETMKKMNTHNRQDNKNKILDTNGTGEGI